MPNYKYTDFSETICEEELQANESINMIKNKEYKNLRNLHRHIIANNLPQMAFKCYTEGDEQYIPTLSFGSTEFKNSVPVYPMSQNKQKTANYYENIEDDECEEYYFLYKVKSYLSRKVPREEKS